MNDNSIWFGRAGQLQQLWAPTGGMLVTRERDVSIFTNKNGGTRTTKALEGARAIQLNYAALGRKNFEYLNQFAQGHMGSGPFILIDPGRRNMLTVNQSSATSQTGDLRGFSATATGSLLSSAASTWGGLPRVVTWAFSTAAPASPTLSLLPASSVTGWYGIPVLQRPHTFWCTVVGGPIDVQLRIDWLSSTGGVVSSATSATFTTNTTTPIRAAVKNATPPATGIWARAYVVPVSATIGIGESLSFLNFQFQEGSDYDSAWVGGTGVYPVTFVGMPEKYGFDEPGMLVSPTVNLQEVR